MFENAQTARVNADTLKTCCQCSVQESVMNHRTALAAALTAFAVLSTAGCAVMRDQQSVGAYVDDATITTQVKARMLDNPGVAGTSISVETLNGTVMLSGFAKTATERSTAESIARDVNGVKLVKNEITVRP
jgi:osmotically-inducible protein OsmY